MVIFGQFFSALVILCRSSPLRAVRFWTPWTLYTSVPNAAKGRGDNPKFMGMLFWKVPAYFSFLSNLALDAK